MIKRIKTDYVPQTMDYTDIPYSTDIASFRPDSEAVRSLKFNPAGGDSSTPLYDFADGKDDGHVSDTLLEVRSGKLDKAEIDTLKKELNDSANEYALKAHSEKVADAVDKALGVNAGSASNS